MAARQAKESMPIEVLPPNLSSLSLDSFEEDTDLLAQAELLYEGNPSVVFLQSDLIHADRMKRVLLALRAADIPTILLVRSREPLVMSAAFQQLEFLKQWDQCSLINVMQICQNAIPERFSSVLTAEAKIELKWLQEWWSASQGPRMARYPGLPWRSFIRKINSENFQFARELISEGDSDLDERMKTFLTNKKKVVCVFPKRWGKDS